MDYENWCVFCEGLCDKTVLKKEYGIKFWGDIAIKTETKNKRGEFVTDGSQ